MQQFLAQVESEVEVDEIADEDLTSEQLLEKLERLEKLQELQSTNQDKLTTIDQSSHSADVRRALERNPDISKERTNLLQGWSDVSFTLKDKIALMRRRAEMVRDMEGVVREAEEGVACYRSYLDTPLPPSVLLAERHEALLEEGVSAIGSEERVRKDHTHFYGSQAKLFTFFLPSPSHLSLYHLLPLSPISHPLPPPPSHPLSVVITRLLPISSG